MSWRRRYLRFLVWLRHSVRVLVWAAVGVVLLAVGGLLFLTRTDPGVEFVLDEGLARIRGAIHGTLTVDDASSGDLLEGVTLRGVAIRDAAGREFVVVDSLRARYSIISFLRGDLVLDGVELWAPRVTVERLPGEESTNASRIFAGPSDLRVDTAVTEPRAGGRRRILLRDVTIEGGEVKVLLPQEGAAPEGAFLEPAPGATKGKLRSYAFRRLDAVLPRVSLVSPEREGIEGAVERLSFQGEILRRPVPLRELRGVVRIVESSVTLEAAVLRVGESDLTGRARTAWGAEGVRVTGDLRAAPLDLRDLSWLEPRLGEGVVYAELGVDRSPASTRWRIRDGDLRLGATRVRGSGEITTGRTLAFREFELGTDSLGIEELRPWLGDSIPFRGSLGGRIRLDGPQGALAVEGDLTLREPGTNATSATVTGIVDLDGAPGAEELVVELEPLDFRLLRRLAPDARVSGTGALRLTADGELRRGLRVDAEVEHEGPGLARSRLEAEGTVRVDTADVHLALDGEVDPLVLGALAEMMPGLEPRGQIEGPFRIRGRLGDLRVGTDVETERGRVALDVRVDARNPGAGYRVAGELGEFEASGLLGRLPEPTVLTGSFSARGRGLDRKSVRGEASVGLWGTRVGPLRVDTADFRVRAEEGMIHLDTLAARTNVARFDGGGRLGLTADGPQGEVRLAFVNDSLASIQPFVFGDTVIAVDVLSPLEREVLRLEGVDVDTLPTSASVALGGRLRGAVAIRGAVDDFDAEGEVSARQLLYGTDYLEGIEARFSLARLPGLEGAMEAEVTSDSIVWSGRRFAGGALEAEWTRPEGRLSLTLRRTELEDYRVRGAFRVDSQGGEVEVEELAFRFDPVVWTLAGPASVAWNEVGVRVEDLDLVRADTDAMRFRADGFVPFRGEADFELEAAGLNLARFRDLLQIGEEVGGVASLRLDVSGTARSPVMEGSVQVDSVLFRGSRLTRVEGRVSYRERALTGDLQSWHDTLRVARIEGRFPADLAFRGAGERIPAEPLDLRVVVDSFPVAAVAGFAEALEEVRGTVSGEFTVGGTPHDVEPSGSVRLSGGSVLLSGLGIRPDRIEGTVSLASDGTANVELLGRSRGTLRVRGTVDLDPVTNPALDLRMTASGFQGVSRRDLSARLGGTFSLTGTYQNPVVSGDLRVEEGTLVIEEVERSAEVVDLSDPAFFDVVDTTMVEPILQERENPFLRNLRVDVDILVERDTWLRSRDMNVEMGGELLITYDRPSGELVLVGQLNPIRGNYRAFGRTFQVRQGQVEFVGTPGLDPNLAIEAVTRLRTQEGEPLTIIATVTGTLSSPRVALSSDAQPPIAQSDLASYLLFGRPSYALGSGESSVLQGQSALLGEVGGSFVLGAAAAQLGTVAQDVGLDYFALTQGPGSMGNVTGFGGTLAATQVEAGKYISEDVFLALLLRPLSSVGSTAQDQFAGFRLEWRIADAWTVEGFVEERFARRPAAGFGNFDFDTPRIFGFFLRRDWGY